MQLKDILSKIASGEAFTDEEKSFAGSFDLQGQLDSAAGAARKKAEKERDEAKAAAAKALAELEEFKAEHDPAKAGDATAKLMARIERLEAAKKAAEERSAAMERTARVRALAKDAGIQAAKGVDSKTLDLLVDNLMGGVDIDDTDAVKTAFDTFKAANSALIAAGTLGGAGVKGTPGAGAFGGKNPFAKKTFNLTEQIKLSVDNPTLAQTLKEAAANEG